MKNWNKFVAGVSALAMTTMMMTTVSAASIPGVNSNFSYELTANAISDTQMEVVLQVTNNPGLKGFGCALQFSGECAPYNVYLSDDSGHVISVEAYNKDANLLVFAMAVSPDAITGESEIFNNFSVHFAFNVTEENIDICEFSSAIISYNSETENVNYDNAEVEAGDFEPETSIETYPYLLGDVNNDGKIRVEDASNAYSISTVYNAVYGNPAASVSCVNYNVEHNVISATMGGENTIPWGTRFSYLMRSGYSYAESADVDQNGYVEEADGDAILQYYTNHAVSLPMETLIGTTQVKTVTITL